MVSEALDFLVLVQHVKCSPVGGRSDPNESMWCECGPHVLAHELEILRPSRMLVLGQGDNARAIRRIVPQLDESLGSEIVKLGRRKGRVELERRTATFGSIDILFVPHPAAPGGTSGALVAAARQVLATRSR